MSEADPQQRPLCRIAAVGAGVGHRALPTVEPAQADPGVLLAGVAGWQQQCWPDSVTVRG